MLADVGSVEFDRPPWRPKRVFEGQREILDLWPEDCGEGAIRCLRTLTEITNRGVGGGLILVCDGLKGLLDTVQPVQQGTVVQTCVVHQLRHSFC
ncbi:transposase [Streptomyces sp. NPDC055709]